MRQYYSTSSASFVYDAVLQIRHSSGAFLSTDSQWNTRSRSSTNKQTKIDKTTVWAGATVVLLLSTCFLCHLLLTLDHTSPVSVILQESSQPDTCACSHMYVCAVWKSCLRNLKGVSVGDGGHVHCLCSFSSLNQVFVYAWMEGTQRCQLVMQQKSARLDQSESLSHSPRPFCYITNMPFTKQPASCQMALNQRRSHILTSTSRKTFNDSNWWKTTTRRHGLESWQC